MVAFEKPDEGSWTEHAGLSTGLIDYEDSINPEFYELEREAIFKRAWLNVGRVEQLPNKGSYFTKEVVVAKTSLLIVKGADEQVRAFHNFCPHRGNKLVWDHTPAGEAAGQCRQFMCKYHGWRYGLDGSLTFVLQEEEFFDLDKSKFGLVPVHCEVWQGFIFVNLADEPAQTLEDFLGPKLVALDGYPFEAMTERYSFRAEINSNWKIYLDAFQEYYHAPILHSQQQVPSLRSFNKGFTAPYFETAGPHRLISTGGFRGVPRHLTPAEEMYPLEIAAESGLMGPWYRVDRAELEPDALPGGINPGKIDPWSLTNFQVFPNFALIMYERGIFLTYHYWPTSVNTHVWEMTYYFMPSRTVSERIQHEVMVTISKEAALQDAATLDGTQRGLESRVAKHFPLSDQELTVRHFHHTVGEWVSKYRAEQGL
jgi:phenylpropionate dioxygenase-like ring-hydroxylating dioxygenase large terminal subunit